MVRLTLALKRLSLVGKQTRKELIIEDLRGMAMGPRRLEGIDNILKLTGPMMLSLWRDRQNWF